MVSVKLLDIISGLITIENILSTRVLEWQVILVGCKIKGINELQARIHLPDYIQYNSRG